jgi:hypothetical protein
MFSARFGRILVQIRQSGTLGSMANSREVWKSAQRMIDRFGDDALHQVDVRIRELKQLKQLEARLFWLKIRDAVQDLIKEKDRGRKH